MRLVYLCCSNSGKLLFHPGQKWDLLGGSLNFKQEMGQTMGSCPPNIAVCRTNLSTLKARLETTSCILSLSSWKSSRTPRVMLSRLPFLSHSESLFSKTLQSKSLSPLIGRLKKRQRKIMKKINSEYISFSKTKKLKTPTKQIFQCLKLMLCGKFGFSTLDSRSWVIHSP